jgi:type IV pilus assembly protein PilM
MEVLLAVAQEILVTRHVEAVQAAGLQPLAIDIEPLATSRSLLDLSNGSGPAGTVAIVDLGASTTDISIYREGRIAFTRSIQLAGNNLTKAIADVLGRPQADAERMKKEMAGIPEIPQAAASDGGDMFGQDFGSTLDFGAADAGLGGTFGAGTSTATDTQSEQPFDVAGSGFGAEAFTSPSESPEIQTGGEAPSIFGVAGPTPAANPFDPEAAPEPAPVVAEAAPADNPFENLFGAPPAGDPFAPPQDTGIGFGAAPAPVPAAPAAMSEEDYLKTQIQDAIMPVLHELVTELRRSLDFYRNRANGLGAQQVVICGGTAKLPGLADFLQANLDAPVALGNPLQYLAAGPKADSQYLQDVGPFFPVSVGLAAREILMDSAAPRKKK